MYASFSYSIHFFCCFHCVYTILGQVLWRAVPKDKFDPNIHGFKVSSVTENIANLQKIVELVSQYVPSATIVFTLSPVPLRATFRYTRFSYPYINLI